MQLSQARIWRTSLASAVSAAFLLSGLSPALANPHERTATAAPRAVERTYTAPRTVERTYTAPRAVERTYTAPRAVERTYTAPRAVERTYTAPRAVERTYSAPRAVERTYAPPRRVERTYTAPRAVERTYSAPPRRVERTYSAPPRRVERTYSAPPRRVERTYTPPRAVERTNTAPRRVERTFTAPRAVERMNVQTRTFSPPRTYVRERFAQRAWAPRTQLRRAAPVRTSFLDYAPRYRTRSYERARTLVASPLMRSIYVAPGRTQTVVYHPAYLTGRIVRETRDTVVLAPPTGPQVIVQGYVPPTYVVNQYVTVPAVYTNGNYYAYPYSQQYQPQLEQIVMNLFGVPVSFVNGYYVPQTTYSSGMPYYGYGYAPYYQTSVPYYNAPAYYNNGVCSTDDDNDGDGTYTYCGNNSYNSYGAYGSYGSYDSYGYGSTTPYDNCVWTSDAYGNTYCAAPQNYGGYAPYGQYAGYAGYGSMIAPQQVQGLVVAKTGTMLMVLGANGLKPIFVNEAPALQDGYAVNGPAAVGQVVDAYGFYNGNVFIATALM